jgi:hypothetical protein
MSMYGVLLAKCHTLAYPVLVLTHNKAYYSIFFRTLVDFGAGISKNTKKYEKIRKNTKKYEKVRKNTKKYEKIIIAPALVAASAS